MIYNEKLNEGFVFINKDGKETTPLEAAHHDIIAQINKMQFIKTQKKDIKPLNLELKNSQQEHQSKILYHFSTPSHEKKLNNEIAKLEINELAAKIDNLNILPREQLDTLKSDIDRRLSDKKGYFGFLFQPSQEETVLKTLASKVNAEIDERAHLNHLQALLNICIKHLEQRKDVEGLFRVQGNYEHGKRLDTLTKEPSKLENELTSSETRDIAKLMSRILLNNPLLTKSEFEKFLRAMKNHEKFDKLIEELAPTKKEIFATVFKFLKKISKNPDTNMDESNLAICCGRNLICFHSTKIEPHLFQFPNEIATILIKNADKLFG